MKTSTTKLFQFLFIALFVGLAYSCSDDDDSGEGGEMMEENTQTIVDLALETADLSSLVAALQAADGDLVSVLSGDGPYTVFAPTNAAFEQFLTDNNFASLEDIPTDVLTSVLLNHVVSGTHYQLLEWVEML